jgi:hypothetical protein
VGDHWIVDGIGVFSNVEIFLHDRSRAGEERPVGTDSGAIFIRLRDIVGANRDQPAIGNLKFTMELNKPFRLPAVLGAESSAAEDQNQWRSAEFPDSAQDPATAPKSESLARAAHS